MAGWILTNIMANLRIHEIPSDVDSESLAKLTGLTSHPIAGLLPIVMDNGGTITTRDVNMSEQWAQWKNRTMGGCEGNNMARNRRSRDL